VVTNLLAVQKETGLVGFAINNRKEIIGYLQEQIFFRQMA
jgi:hypothetical protein